MSIWVPIARMFWAATKYLFLIVFSSIVGANLGTGVGLAIGAMTGEPSWVAHGRCAGWVLFVVVAAVGAPFGFVYFCSDKGRKRSGKQRTPPLVEPEPQIVEPQKIEGRAKSILVAPLIGAFMGLILGGMAAGALVALYFFVALSPLGSGGWWPILPLTFRASDGGFSTKDPFILIPWLIVVGMFVILGVIFGLFGTVSVGQRRFQVFRPKRG